MIAKIVCWLFAPLFRSQQFRDLFAVDVARHLDIPNRKELVTEIIHEVAQCIDIDRLARRVPVPPVADYIADTAMHNYIGDIADRAAKLISASDVADHLDLDAIAEKAADNIDLDDVAEKAAENIDVSAVAENVEKGRDFVKAVAEEISLSDLAGELCYTTLTREIDIDWRELAEHLDSSEIANNIECSEIASCLDVSDIASEISMSDLADEINVSDVAAELDYEELAKALIAQFVEANAKAKAVEVRPSVS